MDGSPKIAKALALVFIVIGAGTAIGFLLDLRPPVATEHGVGVDRVITYLLVTTGIIFVAGHFTLGWLVARSGKSGGYEPVSRKVEWAWAMVPLLLFTVVSEVGVIAMGSSVWKRLYGATPAGSLEVEIVGRQFEWLMRYPGVDGKFGATKPGLVHATMNPLGLDRDDPAALDDIIARGSLHLPVDRPVVIRLRSHDVLHSFTVPQFRVKQDLIPGITTRVQFTPVKTGKYELACAELCGLGHYRMRGFVNVLPEAEFTSWLGNQESWFR